MSSVISHSSPVHGSRAGGFRALGRRLTAVVLPPCCVGCGREGVVLCLRCSASLANTEAVRVVGTDIVAAAPFEGVVRHAVLALKYHNRRDAARVVARLVVDRIDLSGVDLVTWAPTTPARAHRRGFDQSHLVAREVARALGVPCRMALRRRRGRPQTGLPRADRLDPASGPSFRGRSPYGRLRIAVIDDVVTTGATLQAAVAALYDAGVGEVRAVAVAAALASARRSPRGATARRVPPTTQRRAGRRASVATAR